MYHQHHHIIDFLHNRELNELYASMAIRSFALSLISIFIPIYLIQLNYSLPAVLIFFAIVNSTHIIFSFPVAKIAARYGFKHSIFFSIPLLILFYSGLYSIEQFNWPLWLLAIIVGLSGVFFWIGYHVDLCIFSDKKKRGSELGAIKIINSIFYAIGPIVGGLILTFGNFKILIAITSILLLLSALPLFFSKDVHEPINFSLKKIFKGQKIKDALVFFMQGIDNGVGGVIWPIFIFFYIFNNYTSLGIVFSLSVIVAIIFTFIVGKRSDAHKKSILKIGAALNSFGWLLRSLVSTTFHVFAVDSFVGLAQTLITIPMNAMVYDKAGNKGNMIKFILFREITTGLGKVILFLSMIFIVDLIYSFFAGAGASLFFFLF